MKIIGHNRYGIKNGRFHNLTEEECLERNEEGMEIFWAVNSFKGQSRKEENLASLDYLYADMDKLDKEEMKEIISKGLPPTIIIESKNGFHIYWELKEPLEPTPNNLKRYKAILSNLIVPFYRSDNAAKDAARVLRVPEFYHLKEPSNPFLIKLRQYKPKYLFNLCQFESCYSGNFFRKEIKQRRFMKNDFENNEAPPVELCGSGLARLVNENISCEAIMKLNPYYEKKHGRYLFKESTTKSPGGNIDKKGYFRTSHDSDYFVKKFGKKALTPANLINCYFGSIEDFVRRNFPEVKI